MELKTNTQIKPRQSNLELFRIITMILIVAHHYVINSGLMSRNGPILSDLLSAPSIFLLLFGAWGKTGINCFMLITGYFMCKSQISTKKFMKFFLEIEFYKIIIYAIFVVTGYSRFSISGLVTTIIPFTSIDANFVGCFLVFYLTIPFLNILVKNMNEKQHIRLLLLTIGLYVLLGTVFGTRITMNYVSWFIVLYLTSSYVRLYPRTLFDNKKLWGILSLGMIIVSTASVLACTYIKAKTGAGAVYYFLADSNKILAFCTAFCAFMFFKNIEIKYSKFINTVAASAFGVLLIHSNSETMRQCLWEDILSTTKMYHSKWLIIHAVVSVIGIYVVCTIIDILRIKFIEKPFFNLWDKLWNKILQTYLKIETNICEKLKINTQD